VKEYDEWKYTSKHKFYVTEKLDGSSFTAYIRQGEFGICSRNLELKPSDDNAYWQASAALDLNNKLTSLQRNIALQGELVGPGVQGNLYGLNNRTVYFFTGYDIDAGRRLTFAELKGLLDELKLPMVPVLEYAYVLPSENVVENMLAYAEGKSALNPRADREGVVVRGVTEEFSFKAISNRYLLNDPELNS
jgi:RNA ligase (TIGR02306 family)